MKHPSKVHKFEALNKTYSSEGYPGLDEAAYIFTVVRHPAIWPTLGRIGLANSPAG